MALKKKLTKEEYDKLSDLLKAEYMTDGEGYKLDLSDDEDTGPLKRALEREKANSATSKKRLAEVEAELEKLNESDARKRGDIATLEKQWEKKIGETKAEYDARIAKLTANNQPYTLSEVFLHFLCAKIHLQKFNSKSSSAFE